MVNCAHGLLQGGINVNLHVRVTSQDAPGVRDDQLARALMEELDAIPRISVAPAVNDEAPAGSKATNIQIAEIVIALGAAGAVLPTLINAIRDWIIRQPT